MPGPSPRPAILSLLTDLRCTLTAQLAGNMTHTTYAATSIPSPATLGSQFAEVGMLDALATLCSMHSLCESAAVSLEVSPEGFCLIFATADQSHPEVRRFIEDCFHHVQLLAKTYEAHRTRGPDRGDIHKDAVYMARWRAFAIMVHKQCYSKFRQYLRSADFQTFMQKMDNPEGFLSPYTRHEERVEFWRLADEINNVAQCLVTTTEPEQEEDEMYHWALYLLGDCIYRRSFDSSLGKRLNSVFGSGATRVLVVACSLARSIGNLVAVAETPAMRRYVASGGRLNVRARWIDATVVPSIVYRLGVSLPNSSTTTDICPAKPTECSADAHPETILVQYIVDQGIDTRPHIALSRAACHACCAYIASVNAAHHRDFRVRHCSGTIPATWACPSGDDATTEAFLARLSSDVDALRKRGAGAAGSAPHGVRGHQQSGSHRGRRGTGPSRSG